MLKSRSFLLAAIAVAHAHAAEMTDLAKIPHPRLWFPAAEEAALRQKINGDPLAARLQSAIMAEADKVLKNRTCRHQILDGKRLLSESRLALHNVMHCAWAWRLTGSEAHRLRAIAELDAACAFKDWNTSHFLDTAEMATAVAVGYDWLYATLSTDQRATYEQAIVSKALKPSKIYFDEKSWWAKTRNNWSQVCGAGIALASAAIAGHDENLSESLFTQGCRLVKTCEQFYRPDGMYPEGPSYWHYGTNYHIMLVAACPPLGRPVADDPILQKAGDSIMHLMSPNGVSFNFADGNPSRAVPSAAQSWIANHYRDAAQSRHIREQFSLLLDEKKGKLNGDRWFPLTLLWLPPEPPESSTLPLAATFNGEQSMALFRTGWDPDDAWLAIKGGTPSASHGHMDVGAFVYDAHGLRWFHDLGSENYNLPGYFGGSRWTYYRLQNRSHNTLEINNQLQNPLAKPCPITRSSLTGNPLAATFDISDAYQGSAAKVIRSARFDKISGSAHIEDQISSPEGDVVWRALTDADITIDGTSATLRKKDRKITVRRISPNGTWSIASATPPLEAEKQNEGFRILVLTVPKAPKIAISVEIRP